MIKASFSKLPNQDLRQYADEKGVRFWQIAAHLGVSEAWVTRKMRSTLTDQDRKGIIAAIDEAANQQKE